MDTKEISREQISALADGELVDAHVNVALAVLRQPEEQITWDLYHQIGDVLRSDEMAFSLSEGFTAKMHARLDAEPAIIAPHIAPQLNSVAAEQIIVPAVAANGGATRRRFVRRFAMPGAAVAAAVVAVVFVTSPQQSVTMANNGAATSTMAGSGITTVAASSSPQSAVQVSSLAQQGEVARDPRIDDYLLAHQRFSPSMYSSVQYARSAAFAIDSDK